MREQNFKTRIRRLQEREDRLIFSQTLPNNGRIGQITNVPLTKIQNPPRTIPDFAGAKAFPLRTVQEGILTGELHPFR